MLFHDLWTNNNVHKLLNEKNYKYICNVQKKHIQKFQTIFGRTPSHHEPHYRASTISSELGTEFLTQTLIFHIKFERVK